MFAVEFDPADESVYGVVAAFSRAFFWRDERATLPYDLWVIAILAFVWLVPPDWLSDPTASALSSGRLACWRRSQPSRPRWYGTSEAASIHAPRGRAR